MSHKQKLNIQYKRAGIPPRMYNTDFWPTFSANLGETAKAGQSAELINRMFHTLYADPKQFRGIDGLKLSILACSAHIKIKKKPVKPTNASLGFFSLLKRAVENGLSVKCLAARELPKFIETFEDTDAEIVMVYGLGVKAYDAAPYLTELFTRNCHLIVCFEAPIQDFDIVKIPFQFSAEVVSVKETNNILITR